MVALGYLFVIVILSYVIWATSESFERASSYLGRNMAPGVRGATINAIGSSMPELFTAVFFLAVVGNEEGFAGGFGTMVGSAMFNMLIIPSVVILTILYSKQKSIIARSRAERRSMMRDTLFLMMAQVLLFIVIRPTMYWWNGLLLMFFYGFYVWLLLRSNRQGSGKIVETTGKVEKDIGEESNTKERSISSVFVRLDIYALITHKKDINDRRAWAILLIAMMFMGISCLNLVYICEDLGKLLNLPILVIAVLVAGSATSVPDMFISIRDAKKGNTADALSNAFGSNIFDICIALGLPIFMYILLNDKGVLYAFSNKEDWATSMLLLYVMSMITAPACYLLVMPKISLKLRSSALLTLYILFLLFIYSYSADLEFIQRVLQGIMATDIAQGLL